MADSVVHFEVPADDVERAKAFYSEAFGWKVEAYPGMNYHGATTTEVGPDMMPLKPGAINGGLFDRATFPIASPVLTIGVDDIDEALAKVERLGGKTLRAREAVADMGFTGYFTDPEGNVMGLWQNAPAK
jgi:predicted enzyme related to lactoylglutathione lyase